MKSFIKFFVLGACILLGFVSCLGDEDNVQKYSAWGIGQEVTGMSYDFKVLLDGGATFIPTNTASNDFDISTGDRLRIFFDVDAGIDIDALDVVSGSLQYIVKYTRKEVLEISDTVPDSLGNDPLGIYASNSIWQTESLLTIPFTIDVGNYSTTLHSIDLVYFPDSMATLSNGIYLELRHNAEGDGDDQVVSQYACFDMETIEPFQNVTDSVPYTIVINNNGFASSESRIEGWYKAP